MKNIRKTFFTGCSIMFILVGSVTFGQDNSNYVLSFLPEKPEPRTVKMDNELEPSDEGTYEDIHSNPLLLNGHLLNYNDFSVNSVGVLKLMTGDPTSSEAKQISFTICLRRNGKILRDPSMEFMNKELNEVEISSVLQFALSDDHLIITPVEKKYWKAKRILRVARGC